MGTVRVQLGRLVPNEVIVKEYALEGASRGTIKLRMLFDPQVIESKKASIISSNKGGDGVHDASTRLTGEAGAMTKMGKAVFGRIAGTTIGFGKALDDMGKAATRTGTKRVSAAQNVEAIASAKGLKVVSEGDRASIVAEGKREPCGCVLRMCLMDGKLTGLTHRYCSR